MGTKIPLLFLAIGFCLPMALPLPGVEPDVLEWIPGDERKASLPAWAEQVRTDHGSTVGGVWRVSADAPVGEGRIDLVLSGIQRPHALALTLSLPDEEMSDLAIQLFNREGKLVAVDLFGNVAESARAGRTDTFIVPLASYPSATVVSIRRISGQATLGGILAFPVVTALDELPGEERARLARMLGEVLADSSPPDGGSAPRIRVADNDAILEKLLSDPSYPSVDFSATLPESEIFPACVSGTCYRFFTAVYFQLFNSKAGNEMVEFVSSNDSLRAALDGSRKVALASLPPDPRQMDEFRTRTGHPLLVVPVARDAVEVLVHPGNRIDTMDFAALRRIFSDEAQNAARTLYWDKKSGLSGPILVAGGRPEWGTSRFFAETVLGGERLHSRMSHFDVAYSNGVERFVSQNLNAIGFAQHKRRVYAVKALAIGADASSATKADAETVASGAYPLTRYLYLLLGHPSPEAIPQGVREFASRLLSRDGQRAVAKAGSFALSAKEVKASRALIGLD